MRNGEHLLNQNCIEKEHVKGGDNMARPLKELDKKQFEALCSIWCTQEEICLILNVTDKTLNKWCKRTYKVSFSEIYKKFSSFGKMMDKGINVPSCPGISTSLMVYNFSKSG